MIPVSRRAKRPLRPSGDLTLTNPGNVFNLRDVGGSDATAPDPSVGAGPPTLVDVRLRGMPRAANGMPAARLSTPEGFDTTSSSRASGDAARWEGDAWVIGLASTTRSLGIRYPNGGELALVIPAAPTGSREVTVDVPAAPAAMPVAVRVRGAVAGSRFFVGAVDASLVTPPDGRGARWDGDAWLFGVPHGTRSLRVRFPDGAELPLALPEAAPGASVAVDSPRPPPPVATEGRVPLRVRGARRDQAQAAPTFTLVLAGRDVTGGQQPDGRPAAWDGNDWIVGIPRGTGSIQVRFASGRVGTFSLRTDLEGEVAIEVPSDQIPLDAAPGDGPLVVAPTTTLAFVRVWLIDPPIGTKLFRVFTRDGVVNVAPNPPQEVAGYGAQLNGATVLPGSARATVPVFEHRLPDTADGSDRTVEAWALLPSGERVDVPLSPVPSDGILRLDLSAKPGERASADSGPGLGTIVVVGAVVAAGVLLVRRSAARNNPSCGPSCGCSPCQARHNPSPRRRRAGRRRA